MGKKILIAVGALFALMVVAIVAIPFFVDVDKYRPQIVTKANEYLNGKLELGKLSLSLWGQIKVRIDGLSISDPSGQKVFSVQDAYFHIPFTSVFAGSPELILKADNPVVLAIKDKRGKLNMMGLVKAQPTPAAGTPSAATPSSGGSASSVTVPLFVARARMGVEVLHAKVTYRDATTDFTSEFPDMNLEIKDLSLTRTAQVRFWTDIDTKLGKTFALKGPIKLDGKIKPELVNSKFDHVTLGFKFDMDDTEMSSGAIFHKAKGVPCNAELSVTASAKEAKIEKMNAHFHNAEIQSSGVISNLGAAPAAAGQPAPSPVVQFQAKSNSIDFKPWNELVPMLKEYDLSGSAHFDASANGPADKLAYKAKFGVDGLSAKGPMLKAKPVIGADLTVSTDKVDHFGLSVKAPGNDLEISGSLNSFTAPKILAKLASPGMDLDQLVDFPPPAKKGAAAPGAGGGGGGGSAPAAGGGKGAADYDALLAPLRENKMLAATDATLTTDIKFIKAYNVRISDIGAKVTFKDLTAALDGFRMKIFSGNIKSDFAVALRPAHPTYKFSSTVEGLVIQDAVESQFAFLKNTLLGKANFSMNGSGASFNPDPAIANLTAKGSMKVADATFATIDIGKMVTEALNSSIEKVGDKVPALKGKKLPGLGQNGTSKFDYISSDFTIAGGKFSAPNFVAKAQKDKGIDLAGNTTVGLKDNSLNAEWKVIDTYNLTKARDLSVNVAGTDVPHILAKGNDPVQFPIHVGGTLTEPTKSYTEVPEYFAGVAVANVTAAATGKAKAQVAQQVQKLIPKGAPPAIQNGLGGLSKKLFGH
jgi:uncharacterized protein involved in outer membrane biogenesis